MKKLIVANWKMNVPNLESWRRLSVPRGVDVVICPPFTYLYHVSRVIYHDKNIKLGAQDCFWEGGGAYTGEVSPTMIKNLGAEFVIIGHSERRRWLGETDKIVNEKVIAALRAGLKVILCVGEPLSVRRNGLTAAKNFVKDQLQKDLRAVRGVSGVIIAYEPIWAIGTGKADRPSDTAGMAKFIKKFLSTTYHLPSTTKVLYGGSAASRNIKNFLQYKEIDGALVGGASLKVGEFRKIVKIASESQ